MSDPSDVRKSLVRLGFVGVVAVCPWLPVTAATDTFEAELGSINWFRVVWIVPAWYGLGAVVSYSVFDSLAPISVFAFHFLLLAAAATGSLPAAGSVDLLVLASGVFVVLVGGYLANRFAEVVRYWWLGRENYLLPFEEIYEVDEENGRREKLVGMDRSESVLLMGNSQSGKTATIKLLMEQMQQSPDDAFVVLDAKGDEAGGVDGTMGQYQRILERKGYDYIQLSLRNPDVHWNVFREAPIDEPEKWDEAYQRVAKALFHDDGQRGQNQFFHDAAQQVFKGILLHLMRESPDEYYPSNETLVEFCQSNDPEDLEELFRDHDDLRPIATQISSEAEKMSLGVYAHVQQKVSEMFRGSFAERGDFSIREYMQDPSGYRLLLNMPQSHAEVMEGLYRFFLDWSIAFALSRRRVEDDDAACYYVLDEFSALPKLDRIDSLINRGLEFNVRTLVGLQAYSQIKNVYGEEAEGLLSSFSNAVLLDPGNDSNSKEFILESIGQRHVERKVNRPEGRFEVMGDRQETTVEKRYPIDESEFNGMQPGDAFVFQRGTGYIYGNLHEIDDVRHKFKRAHSFSLPWQRWTQDRGESSIDDTASPQA